MSKCLFILVLNKYYDYLHSLSKSGNSEKDFLKHSIREFRIEA